MTKPCKYDSSKISTEDCINDLCHELRTSLQIISGISENALEYPTTTTTTTITNLKNKNISRYYNDMTIINKNCERLTDKVESCISTMKNQCECLQSINASLQHKKLDEEKCKGYYFSNKLIIDKKEIVIPF